MHRYRVDFSKTAEREIEEAGDWIAAGSPQAAEHWIDGLLSIVGRLERMPARFPLAPENEDHAEEIRQLIYGRYRVLFTVRPDRVEILHVRHGARLPLQSE